MDNENEEVLEEGEVEETEAEAPESEETQPEPNEEEKKVEKPTETLEARKARLERQLSQTNKKLGIEPQRESQPNKTGALDYAQKAFLVANGIKGTETKLVEEAMRKTGETLEQVLENPYFQAKLENTRNLAKTTESIPKGNNRGGKPPVDQVDYWLQKPIEEVPAEMRRAVVNAKYERDKNKSKFYNS